MNSSMRASPAPLPHHVVPQRFGVYPLPLDVYMTRDAVITLAPSPGLKSDQFQITYNQGTLQLTGTINNVADSGEAKVVTW